MHRPPPRAAAPRLLLPVINAVFAAALSPIVCYYVARVFYPQPMNYNEGWNVMFVSRLVSGAPLYVPLDRFPLTPLNYPPLSYFIIGGLSRWTGDILLTGRIVTVLSSALLAWLIFTIVGNVTRERTAAIFAALFWLCLMARIAPVRLVMYDPQMLAHAFSTGALCLYSKWRGDLTASRTWMLAALCCVAVFIKHLVVAVPATIALALFLENRKMFLRFALGGIVIGGLAVAACALYGGANFISNFIDTGRPVANHRLFPRLWGIFGGHLAVVVAAPFALLWLRRRKEWIPYLFYFVFSFALAAYTCRGVGVDVNTWFDFFIAAALVFGIFAGFLSRGIAVDNKWRAALAYGVLILSLLPLAERLPTELGGALRFGDLHHAEQSYRERVELLRSIPGPALFENLLLGYDAGKPFLLEPFNAAQMIVIGRIRETILTDAIRRRDFGAIVLGADINDALCAAPWLAATTSTRWTPGTLRAIAENYQPLSGAPWADHLYVPRTTINEFEPVCAASARKPRS